MLSVPIRVLAIGALFFTSSQAFAFEFFRSVMGCLTMGGITATGAIVANSLANKDKNMDTTAIASSAALGCVIGAVLTESIATRAGREAEAALRVENTQLRNQYIHTYQALCLIEKRCTLSAIPINPNQVPQARDLSAAEKESYRNYNNTGMPQPKFESSDSEKSLSPIRSGN